MPRARNKEGVREGVMEVSGPQLAELARNRTSSVVVTRQGESELALGETVQQQSAAVLQELPMLQHADLSVFTPQKRVVHKI